MTLTQLDTLLKDLIVTCECGGQMGIAMVGDTDFLFMCESEKCFHQVNLDFEKLLDVNGVVILDTT